MASRVDSRWLPLLDHPDLRLDVGMGPIPGLLADTPACPSTADDHLVDRLRLWLSRLFAGPPPGYDL